MNKKESMKDVIFLAAGEAAVALLVTLGAFAISLFTDYIFGYPAMLGALLGAAITVLNYLFLTISVNRAVDSYLEIRGSREMTEEEAERFTAENSMAIQNKIKFSFIIRTASMLAVLVLAFVTGLFDPICAAIPMFVFRPLIYIFEIFKKKKGN